MIITNNTFFINEEPKTIQVVNMRLTPTPKGPIPIIITNNSENYMRFEKRDELASLIDTRTNYLFTQIFNVTAEPFHSQKQDDEILNITQHKYTDEILNPGRQSQHPRKLARSQNNRRHKKLLRHGKLLQ